MRDPYDYAWLNWVRRNYILWNLRKWTPRIAETSEMRKRGRGPKSFPIVYYT